ncbi:MAG: hypothetical protein II317_01950 [Clostridia bacterium]|nr:hypothetical protein [Clostridia bacterium]
MKYEPIGEIKQSSLAVDTFDGGLNISLSPNAINNNELSEAVNVWYKDGFLQKRPGIKGDIQNIIWQEQTDSYEIIRYKCYDNSVFIEDKEYKVITACRTDLDSYERYYVYLVDTCGNVKNAGILHFGRTDSQTFYIPKNILFFSGKAVTGGGIYAVVSKYNMANPKNESHSIYEIDENLENWNMATGFYLPTIYINGRGNRYEEAREVGYAFGGTPKMVESVNMLNGGFKAYFSSDGYSSSFSLPVKGLDFYSTIKCRVYVAPDVYTEWIVSPEFAGKSETFYNQEVTLVADRDNGVISFSSPSGAFAIPIMETYKCNNICITAYKDIENGKKKIASSTVCAKVGNTLIFAGGTEKNKVYCSKTDNPLYFPENSSGKIGDINTSVTALKNYKDSIIAFKKSGIYKISVKEGKAISEDNFIPDSAESLYFPDTLSVKEICNSNGTSYPSTVKQCGDNLVWLSTDNNVYSMSPTGAIYNISFNIQPRLSEIAQQFHPYITDCFALVLDGNYMLFFGEKVFLMNFSVKGMRYPTANWNKKESNCSWYYWNIDEKITIFGGLFCGGKAKFLCGDAGNGIMYFAVAEGDTDISLNGNADGEIETKEYKIKCITATRLYDMEDVISKKFIERVKISAFGDMMVEYLAPSCVGEYHLVCDDSEVLYTPCNTVFSKPLSMKGVRMFGLRFETDKKFILGAVEFKYRLSQF